MEKEKTLQEALAIIFRDRQGKRSALIEKVGRDMYKKLCVLGFITDGATIDPKTKNCIRVWQTTNNPNLFEKIEREQSEQEIQFLNKQIEFSL